MRTHLELLRQDHARALESFELANRAFFAERVGDRGDEFFEHFDDRLSARVDENAAGSSLLFVVVDERGEVLGRVNITDIDRPELTELGFRVAEDAQGGGIATAMVAEALQVAADHGVTQVRARVAVGNPGSRRVLEKCGFEPTGPADRPEGSAEEFLGYRITLG